MIDKDDLVYFNSIKNEHTDLIDIRSIEIDSRLPLKERLQGFMQDIGNPYHFKCGDVEVILSYSEKGKFLEQIIRDYFIYNK